MSYVIKRHEWELTPEEQEKARFILKTTNANNESASRDGVVPGKLGMCEKAAFDYFKGLFYSELRHRLGIRIEISPLWGGSDGFYIGTFNILADGTKVIAYRVEKEE